MQRIVYVWNYKEWGGAQIYFLSLIKAVKNTGRCEVGVIVPDDSSPKLLGYLEALDVSVEFIEAGPTPVGPERGFVRKLRHRVKIFKSENRLVTRILQELESDGNAGGIQARAPAIVHIDLGFWQSYRALSRLCLGTTVFVTQHTALVDPGGLRGRSWRLKGRRISRFMNFVVLASNNDAKRSLERFLRPEKFDGIRVMYSGFEPDEFKPVKTDAAAKAAARERYSLPQDRPLLTALGQFVERKGCWVLLESLKKLQDAGESFQCLWLGTSLLEPEIEERIDSYRLGDAFRFLPGEDIGPTRHEMLSLLAAADIFVLPSFREGLPIALVEAMALGLPCIASSVGAIPEAIVDDASGLLVPPGEAGKLADAIRTLIHDPKTREMFGTAARAIAFEKFNQQKTAEETLELYRAVFQH